MNVGKTLDILLIWGDLCAIFSSKNTIGKIFFQRLILFLEEHVGGEYGYSQAPPSPAVSITEMGTFITAAIIF